MKKTLLIVLCALLSLTAGVAREIPREKAAATAAEFFRKASPSAVGVQASALRLVKESPSMYVFENEGGGYVIAAADDVAAPVLAWSPEGAFPVTDMPVNMKSLLDWYERIIAFARQQGWEPAATADKGLVGAGSDAEVTLKTARWGQGTPFNDLSPVVNGQKCPSGCVATAQAIIMKYYEYPERGTGTLPGYDFGWDDVSQKYKYHIDGYALGHVYDWKNMPDNASGCTQYQAAQIAQLLYDIGVMSEMDYAPEGSGAGSMSPLKLTKYFGYDKSMQYVQRNYYSTERWEQMIRDEIDAGRPVFHCGFNPDGGHAFVMDGYRGRYFSINYGWSGGSAWYLISPIEGHEKELTAFYDGQDMILRFMPDAGGEPLPGAVVPDSFLPFRWNFEEESIWGGWFWFWNYGIYSTEMEIAYGLFDRDEKFKKVVSETVTLNPTMEYVPELTITFPNKIEDGDQILLARRDGSNWTPLPQSRQSRIQFDRSRKLPQMVSVGHSFGRPDQYQTNGAPRVFFDMYKDIWWEIEREDGVLMADSSLEDIPVSVTATMLDSDTGLARFEVSLSEGTYRMTVRNFDETLSFTFTL